MLELEEEHKSPFGEVYKKILGSQIMRSLPSDVRQQFQWSTGTLYPNLDQIFDKINLVIRTLNSRIFPVNSDNTKKNNSNNTSNLSTVSYVSQTSTNSGGGGSNSSSGSSGSTKYHKK